MSDEVEDFGELAGPGELCSIEDTAKRGISIPQLLKLVRFICKRCGDTGLMDCWSGPDGKPANIHTMNLYQVNSHIILPSTRPRQCSFVELVAEVAAEQLPEWFVSHWWGEPVVMFVACLQKFASMRGGRGVFWICAYANNQHNLAAEVTADPKDSSFRRAMLASKGTIMVLDSRATTFQRVWCTYETAITINDGKPVDLITFAPGGFMTLAQQEQAVAKGEIPVPTVTDEGLQYKGHCQMISDGLLQADMRLTQKERALGKTPEAKKASREKDFPLDVIRRGMNILIQSAQTSVHSDKVHILNSICGRGLDEEVVQEHPAYTTLNATLRARFAMALLYQVVSDGGADKKQMFDVALRKVQEAQLADATFDFPHSADVNDEMIVKVAGSLSSSVHRLSLCLQRQNNIGDESAFAVADKFKELPLLEKLRLHFWTCKNIGDAGLSKVGAELRHLSKLRELQIDLSHCDATGDIGVKGLAEGMKRLPALRLFALNVSSCTWVTDEGVTALAGTLPKLPDLVEDVAIQLASCTWVTDKSLTKLCSAMGQLTKLKRVYLQLFETEVADGALQALGQSMEQLTSVEDFSIVFSKLSLDTRQQAKGRSKKGKKNGTRVPGLLALSEGVRKMQSLRAAKFDFHDCEELPNDQLNEFLAALGQARLQKFHLTLFGVKNLGLSCWQALSDTLSRLGETGELRDVQLRFNRCEEAFTEEAAQALYSGLEQLGDVTDLFLRFGMFTIGDSELEALASALSNLTSVKNLNLNIVACNRLQNVVSLEPMLAAMEELEEVTLEFSKCNKLNKSHVDSLRGHLEERLQDCLGRDSTDLLQFSKLAQSVTVPKGKGKGKLRKQRSQENGKAKGKGKGGKGGKNNNDSYKQISKQRKDVLRQQVEDFVSGTEDSFAFGEGALTSPERAFVHEIVSKIGGIVSTSFGLGDARNLTLMKDQGVSPVAAAAMI